MDIKYNNEKVEGRVLQPKVSEYYVSELYLILPLSQVGKAQDFDSCNHWFKSSRGSQLLLLKVVI